MSKPHVKNKGFSVEVRKRQTGLGSSLRIFKKYIGRYANWRSKQPVKL